MNTPSKLYFLFAQLFFFGILVSSAQNKTATITIQTQEQDGTISTKTYTFDNLTDIINWNDLLKDEADFDRDVVMDITLDEDNPGDKKPWMGIHYDSPQEGVVQITYVVPNSPAAKAGLQRGDIIRQFEGVAVKTGADLTTLMRQYRPDDEVKLTVEYRGKTREVLLVLGSKADPIDFRLPQIRFENDSTGGRGFQLYVDNKPKLGVTVEEGDSSARILFVRPGSPAERGGLQPGDEITAIDQTPVNDPESLINEIRMRSAGDTIMVTFRRGNRVETGSIILLPELEEFGRRFDQSLERFRGRMHPPAPFRPRRRNITIEKRIGFDSSPTPPDASALILEQLDLYPNPASETLTVAMRTSEQAPVLLILTDAQGKEIARYEQTPANGLVKHIFDTSLLTAGQYVLTISQGNKTLVERIIIQD